MFPAFVKTTLRYAGFSATAAIMTLRITVIVEKAVFGCMCTLYQGGIEGGLGEPVVDAGVLGLDSCARSTISTWPVIEPGLWISASCGWFGASSRRFDDLVVNGKAEAGFRS